MENDLSRSSQGLHLSVIDGDRPNYFPTKPKGKLNLVE